MTWLARFIIRDVAAHAGSFAGALRIAVRATRVQTRRSISFQMERPTHAARIRPASCRKVRLRSLLSPGSKPIRTGASIGASPEGARLFNLTVRGLTGRNLSLSSPAGKVIADGLEVLRHGHQECPPGGDRVSPDGTQEASPPGEDGHCDGNAVRWTFSTDSVGGACFRPDFWMNSCDTEEMVGEEVSFR